MLRLVSRTDAFMSQIEEAHLSTDRKKEMMDLRTNRLSRRAGNCERYLIRKRKLCTNAHEEKNDGCS